MHGIDVAYYALFIPAILLAITFHEFAHARVALAFGDHTAEEQGRVTLNPIAHLDPVGTIGILVGGFGWGKPVPVNPNYLNHPRADFFVSAAGPATNMVLAAAGGGALHLLVWGGGLGTGRAALGLVSFLILFIQLNLGLGLFNLIPLFPLDGSHMLENLLPIERAYRFKQFNQAFGMPILFSLILIGMFSGFSPISAVIGPPLRYLFSLLVPRGL